MIHLEDFIYRSVFCGLCPAITQTQKNSRHTTMPQVNFERTISVFKQ